MTVDTIEDHLGVVDRQLDDVSDILDGVSSESKAVTAVREAFVKAQLAVADLRRKLKEVSAEDWENDGEDEDEDEDEEEESA